MLPLGTVLIDAPQKIFSPNSKLSKNGKRQYTYTSKVINESALL